MVKGTAVKTKKRKKEQICLCEKMNLDKIASLIEYYKEDHETMRLLSKYLDRRSSTMKKKVNITYVMYKHSKFGMLSCNHKGRLYAEGESLQNLPKNIRNYISNEYYVDIDMVNAGPRIIRQYCRKKKITCKKLRHYINNRDDILSDLGLFHDITRDQAKKLMLRLCNLGSYKLDIDGTTYIPDEELAYLNEFSSEMRVIAEEIKRQEKTLFQEIEEHNKKIEKDNEKKRNKGQEEEKIKDPLKTMLAIVIQTIECECLLSMYNFMKENSLKVGVLCFDGLMVEKNKKLTDDLLTECEYYVYDKTGYYMKLSYKDMETNIEESELPISPVVFGDTDCKKKIYSLYGKDKFIMSEEKLYVFDDITGLYRTGDRVIYDILERYSDYLNIVRSIDKSYDKKKEDSYGEDGPLRIRMPRIFNSGHIANDDWLLDTGTSSAGYLLYSNGIYNMRTGVFEEKFDPKIVFHHNINRNFPKRNEKYIEYARRITVDVMFDDPTHMLMALGAALAMDVDIRKMYICPGNSAAGKTLLQKVLVKCFGGYVGTFKAENLKLSPGNDNRDQGQINRWGLLHRFKRILISCEASMNIELDGNMIKSHVGGGDALVGRLHRGNETTYHPNYTMFSFLNDVPQIKPYDKAVKNRLVFMEFPYVFVDEQKVNTKPHYRLADPDIGKKIKSKKFISGFTHLIFDYYLKYLKEGFPESDNDAKRKWTEESNQKNVLKESLSTYFMITGDRQDTLTKPEMKEFYNNIKREGKIQMSYHVFNRHLCEIEDIKDEKIGNIRVWTGLKQLH